MNFEGFVKAYTAFFKAIGKVTKRVTASVVVKALQAVHAEMPIDDLQAFANKVKDTLSWLLRRNRDQGSGVRLSTPVCAILRAMTDVRAGQVRGPPAEEAKAKAKTPPSGGKSADSEPVMICNSNEEPSASTEAKQSHPHIQNPPHPLRIHASPSTLAL